MAIIDSFTRYSKLKTTVDSLKNDFGLTPVIGAELEFYLLGDCTEVNLSELQKRFRLKIKKERGHNQFEVDIPPSLDIPSYPNVIANLRKVLGREAKDKGLEADFCSKPFPDDFGSSIHIHLNFLEDTDIEQYAEILCHYLPSTINAFLPEKEDYARLDSRFMAPTHISYGGNNRTTLIRIPDASPRRLEHRLASSSADPHEVISAILESIYLGLGNPEKITRLPKTHGNAFDPQYGLTKIVLL